MFDPKVWLYTFKVEDVFLNSDGRVSISGRSPLEIQRNEFQFLFGQPWGSWVVKGVETFAHGRPFISANEGMSILLGNKE